MIRRVFVGCFLPLVLLLSLIPLDSIAYATSNLLDKDQGSTSFDSVYYLLSEDDSIPLYADDNGDEEIYNIPNMSSIQLILEEDQEGAYQLISYKDNEVESELEGYVDNNYIVDENTFIELIDGIDESIEKPVDYEGSGEGTKDVSEDGNEDEIVNSDPIESKLENEELNTVSSRGLVEDKIDNLIEESKDEIVEQPSMVLNYKTFSSSREIFRGVAKRSPTNIRATTSTKSNVIRTLHIGQVVTYESHSANWYRIAVGNSYGYIHKKHVTTVKTVPESVRGVAKKAKTNIRTGASTKSSVLTHFPIGTVLNLKTFSKNWYSYEHGNRTGYIHRKHVTIVKTVPEQVRGVAKKAKTNIRTGASTKSSVLTHFPIGTVLNLKTFSKNWYSYEHGNRTGYIHRKHVTIVRTVPRDEQAVTLRSPTNVRVGASTKSSVLTRLSRHRIINVKTFSKNWYSFEYGNKVGYIHRKHIDDIRNVEFQGIAAKEKTNIRTTASTKSAVLKSIPKGTVITYKVHNANWNKTEVVINGRKQTGYIHKKHMNERRTIFLDAGHGGVDGGASANGLIEKNLTLDITKRVQRLLEGQGYQVIMSRESDVNMSLAERSKKANDAYADILVSIHINAGGGRGIETWWNDKNSYPKDSEQLAKDVQSEIIKSTNASNRGVKGRGSNRGNFHMTRVPDMPSALVEVGFIDTKSDADKLKDKNFLQKAAEGIANGIKKFLSL